MQLVAQSIGYSYPDSNEQWALKDFSARFEAGKIYFILGNSGAGKSTLLHCLYGLLDVADGKLFFNGKPYFGPSYNLVPGHPEMALIKQHLNLDPYKSIRDNLLMDMGMFSAKERNDRLAHISAICGIQSFLSKRINGLSGGQRQRAALAKVLMNEPEVLLLDEPFAHLDPTTTHDLYEVIKSAVAALNICAIVVSHQPQDAMRFASNVLFMRQGRCIQMGSPVELYNRPETIEVATYFGEVNVLDDDTRNHIDGVEANAQFIRPHELSFKNGRHFECVGIDNMGWYWRLTFKSIQSHQVVVSYTVGSNVKANLGKLYDLEAKLSQR